MRAAERATRGLESSGSRSPGRWEPSFLDLVRARLARFAPHPRDRIAAEERQMREQRVRVAAEKLDRSTRLRRLDPPLERRPPGP